MYDELRIAAHDVISHCLDHWDAFCEGAKGAGITPAQGLAANIAKVAVGFLQKEGLLRKPEVPNGR